MQGARKISSKSTEDMGNVNRHNGGRRAEPAAIVGTNRQYFTDATHIQEAERKLRGLQALRSGKLQSSLPLPGNGGAAKRAARPAEG